MMARQGCDAGDIPRCVRYPVDSRPRYDRLRQQTGARRQTGDAGHLCDVEQILKLVRHVNEQPVNPEFRPIELTTDDEGTVQVVAELVAVLG